MAGQDTNPISPTNPHPQHSTAVFDTGTAKRRESFAQKLQSVVKMPSLSVNTSATPAITVTSAPATPIDSDFSNLNVSLRPEDYELLHPIGHGASATVYAAIYKPLGKKLAVKLIDLDAFGSNQIDELRKELQIMQLCRHKNILPVYGAFVHNAKLYVLMPFLSGGSCLNIMKTKYPKGLDEASIATILKECLQGVEYLHKNRHIHRDIKAGNLLVDHDGSVFLADFGVSSSLMEGGERKNHRRTFVGTPCWMAPEVLTPERGYDQKADIWSFGITALELALGHAPYAKFPPLKVLMLTLQHDPPTLDRHSTFHKYSKAFSQMIDSCLQKDPSKRPNADELLKHPFFKLAKKKDYLVRNLISDLPDLQLPVPEGKGKSGNYERGVSWDFDSVSSTSSTEYFDDSTSTIDSVELHGTIHSDVGNNLPIIHESDTESVPSTPTSVQKGRFSVNIQKPPSYDTPMSAATEGRRGRFAVTPVGSPDSKEKRGHTRFASAPSGESIICPSTDPIISEQAKNLIHEATQVKSLLKNETIQRDTIDRVIGLLGRFELFIRNTTPSK